MSAAVRALYPSRVSSSLDALPKVGAPATRALNAAGYKALRQLARVPRQQLAQLHGVGPRALGIIQAALEEHGLTLGFQVVDERTLKAQSLARLVPQIGPYLAR